MPDREEQQRIFENIEENIHKNIQKRLALCYNGLEQYNFLLEQSAPSKILQQYSSRLQQVQQAIQAQQKTRMNDKICSFNTQLHWLHRWIHIVCWPVAMPL